MTTDRLGGTTYTFPNVTAFLANQPSAIQYLGDVSAPSPFNNGATGMRHTKQEYYIGYAQDEWHPAPKLTLNYGLRYDYYTPLQRARQPDRQVQHRHRPDRSEHDAALSVEEEQLPAARVVHLCAGQDRVPRRLRHVRRPGPDGRPDPAGRERPRQLDDQQRRASFPVDQAALVANFTSNPNNRSYQPRAYANDYTIPEQVYQYTASVQQELGGRFTASAAYVGSQGRNLFLRSVANQITRSSPTRTRRTPRSSSASSRSSQRDAAGNITGVQNPFAEVDYKTSGGHDSYNAMMLSLNRRSANGLSHERAVHARQEQGQHRRFERGAHGGEQRARSSSDFDYDNGYNNFDVRHTFNLSLLYSLPYGNGRKFGANAGAFTQALLGGWDIGGIVNARSGVPINVLIVRARHRLSRCGAEHLRQPGGGSRGDHQHARRRRLAQRAPARPRPRRRSRSSRTAACCS